MGSGAVRTIAGTMRIHMELEEKIARFKNVEACVVFQSGFAANAGTVSAILGKEDFILSDELNHASIIDGARLSRATIKVFRHKDIGPLRRTAAGACRRAGTQAGDHRRRFLDGRRHWPGGQAGRAGGEVRRHHDGGRRARLAACWDATAAVSVDHFGMHGKVDVQVGTLSKAIGALGGYVCGSRDLIDYLYHRARPFLFSTSHPPSVAATCIAAFDILENEPERIERLWANTRYFQGELQRAGFNIGGVTHAGDARRRLRRSSWAMAARRWSSAALSSIEGVMATGIAFPTVPEGKARIR